MCFIVFGLWRLEALRGEHVKSSMSKAYWRVPSCRTSVEEVVEVDDVELEVT